ncbi:MAG: PDZ domain-containing protein [Gimesia sp.]|nr:PDZ domain-containing protein [Gimesia sp.]
MKKQSPWLIISGVIFSVLTVQQSFADDLPLEARKPGQQKSKPATSSQLKMMPANKAIIQNARGKFQVTTRATGETDLRNFVGIVTEPVPAALAAQLNGMMKAGQGVGVKVVLPNTPAHKAGFKTYDVLTTFNGKAITSSDILRKYVIEAGKNSHVKFGVIRASKHEIIEVTLIQKLYRHFKYSVTPLGKNGAPSVIANKQPATTPIDPNAPFASRSSKSDPVDRDLSLGFSHAPVTTTHNLSLLFIGSVKGGYIVEVNYQDAHDRLQTHQFKGNANEIREQITDMPKHVQMMINERLNDLKMALRGKATFRLQLKGHMQGNSRFIRVFLSRATKDKTVRMVELDHHLGKRPTLNMSQIMGNQIFSNELTKLNPTIQEQIRVNLQRIRIPTAQVRVDNPI